MKPVRIVGALSLFLGVGFATYLTAPAHTGLVGVRVVDRNTAAVLFGGSEPDPDCVMENSSEKIGRYCGNTKGQEDKTPKCGDQLVNVIAGKGQKVKTYVYCSPYAHCEVYPTQLEPCKNE